MYLLVDEGLLQDLYTIPDQGWRQGWRRIAVDAGVEDRRECLGAGKGTPLEDVVDGDC